MSKIFELIKFGNKPLLAIIIGIAVVAFWRGAWGLMDEYIFPNNPLLSLWVTFIFGILILIVTGYVVKELM